MAIIFLYGPPASGKSTLGIRLGKRLRWVHADLDREIEKIEGRTIPEIFSSDGEEYFRDIESKALASIVSYFGKKNAVISLGGGTLLRDTNRALVENSGLVYCIDPPCEEELLRRISKNPSARPLGNKAVERAAHYASFPRRISTYFDLKGSLVIIGEKLGSPALFSDLTIADCNAVKCHPDAADNAEIIPSGESYKNLDTVSFIWGKLNDHRIGRNNCIAAFGGGVTGDMTGFAAATWMRGIQWINFPTTLLSMVDASTGGKTGCDLPIGKNLIGAFHSPALVVIDRERLLTLPTRELINGKAEMIKHQIITGRRDNISDIPTAHEIALNLAVKVGIVKDDPYEKFGKRILLNCGHTIAHALEIATNFSISHGEAVAIGCVEEACLAKKLGLAADEWIREITEHFASAGLPTKMPEGITFESLKPVMRGDKKRNGMAVTFALPCSFGDARAITVDLT